MKAPTYAWIVLGCDGKGLVWNNQQNFTDLFPSLVCLIHFIIVNKFHFLQNPDFFHSVRIYSVFLTIFNLFRLLSLWARWMWHLFFCDLFKDSRENLWKILFSGSKSKFLSPFLSRWQHFTSFWFFWATKLYYLQSACYKWWSWTGKDFFYQQNLRQFSPSFIPLLAS